MRKGEQGYNSQKEQAEDESPERGNEHGMMVSTPLLLLFSLTPPTSCLHTHSYIHTCLWLPMNVYYVCTIDLPPNNTCLAQVLRCLW